MKNIYFIIACLFTVHAFPQTALYNSGNMQIHDQGQMGFHIDLINDGSFDENVGLAGFYSDQPLTVSGAFAATFYDLEIANDGNVSLETSLNARNSSNFITGNFFTNRAQTDNYLNFLDNAISNGGGDISKVNGYVAISNKQNFSFPVGDASQLRQLVLNSSSTNIFAKCAYFFEDPNNPTTFPSGFNTNSKDAGIGAISTREFWRLEGNVSSTIQISWNQRSNLNAIITDVAQIGIIGWRKSSNQWVSIESNSAVGDLTDGFIRSASFIPDDYEVITFGDSMNEATDLIDTDNFLVTPDGDGLNDSLVIPETELSPNNSIQIFNRYGLKVFEKNNYTDEFNGFATTNNLVISKDRGLPSGVYFYILSLDDLGLDFQGFLYLMQQ